MTNPLYDLFHHDPWTRVGHYRDNRMAGWDIWVKATDFPPRWWLDWPPSLRGDWRYQSRFHHWQITLPPEWRATEISPRGVEIVGSGRGIICVEILLPSRLSRWWHRW